MDYDLDYARRVLEQGGLLLDIRTRKEFCSGHLCGAHQIPTPLPPLNSVQKRSLQAKLGAFTKQLHKNMPIVVYCKKGVRAGMAKKALQELGFSHVVNLGGVTAPPLQDIVTGKRKDPYFKMCRC